MPCLDAILKVCRQSNRLGENQARVASLLKQNQKGYNVVNPNSTLYFILEDMFDNALLTDLCGYELPAQLISGVGRTTLWPVFFFPSVSND